MDNDGNTFTAALQRKALELGFITNREEDQQAFWQGVEDGTKHGPELPEPQFDRPRTQNSYETGKSVGLAMQFGLLPSSRSETVRNESVTE